MGVDARLLVGLRPEHTFDRWVELGWHLGERFGDETFYGTRENECITLHDADERDSLPEPFLREVALLGRFWSEDYARGYMPTYCDMADFILQFDPSLIVGYGSDHDEALVAVWTTRADVDEWRQRYYQHGRYSYTGHFGRAEKPEGCSRCVAPPVSAGWASGVEVHRCVACGACFARGVQVTDQWGGDFKAPGQYEALKPEFLMRGRG